MRRVIAMTALVAMVAFAASASGPNEAARIKDQLPSTTTTTEPPPEGVVYVIIDNGRFTPSNLQLNLGTTWIVEWQNNDPPREYSIISRDSDDNGDPIFESVLLQPGDTFQVDFSGLEPGVYRYNTFLGNQRIPGLVDTRPSR